MCRDAEGQAEGSCCTAIKGVCGCAPIKCIQHCTDADNDAAILPFVRVFVCRSMGLTSLIFILEDGGCLCQLQFMGSLKNHLNFHIIFTKLKL